MFVFYKKKILGTVLFMTAFLASLTVIASSKPCQLSDGINVNTAKHRLAICKKGNVIKDFPIAIGYKGIGKKKAGDNKTPLGLYRLAYPRKSNQFKIFIPILYPTAKQLAAGYSGRDVGIHGPRQTSNWVDFLNHLPGATRGCIAVGKNNYIDYVAKWVKTYPGTKVLII